MEVKKSTDFTEISSHSHTSENGPHFLQGFPGSVQNFSDQTGPLGQAVQSGSNLRATGIIPAPGLNYTVSNISVPATTSVPMDGMLKLFAFILKYCELTN
jgi:hypothetical protein